MKFKDISIILLAFLVAMIASIKVFLVFDYKRDFVYLSEIQKSIDLLKNEHVELFILTLLSILQNLIELLKEKEILRLIEQI